MPYVWGILSLIFWVIGFVMFLGLINPKWINKRMKENQKPFTRKKALISWIIFSFLFLLFLGIASPKSTTSAQEPLAKSPVSTPKASEATKAVSTPTNTPKVTIAPVATEDPAIKKAADDKAKKDAEKAKKANDSKITLDKFDPILKDYNFVLDGVTTVVNALADKTADSISAYDILGKLDSKIMDVFSRINNLSVAKGYDKSRIELLNGASALDDGINLMKKYMDAQKVSTLSDIKFNMQLAKDNVQNATLEIAAQSVLDGYAQPKNNA